MFRSSRRRCLPAAALILAAGGPWAATDARASLLAWNNAAGGAASVTSNWNPNLMPGPGDDLTYNIAGAYPVTFNASTPASRTQTFRQGSVTLTMTVPHTTSTGVVVADLGADTATTTLTTGTWNSNASVIVGDALGSSGTLNINDDDADLLITGAGADLTVGNNGDAAMNITGGGLVEVADQFILGSNSGSSPTLTVSGATSALPIIRSTLRVLGSGQSRLGQGGDATVSIASGALAEFAGDVVVANGSASISTVTVSGLGGILNTSATLDIDGDLLLGRNTSAGTAAGAATLNVNSDGDLLVGGTLFVAGDPDGGTATLHTQANGTITTHSLAIGDGATLDLDAGAVNIDGGVFTWSIPSVPAAINGGAGNPVVTLRNGASAAFTRVNQTGQVLTVGAGTGANFADFDIRTGSHLTLHDGISTIGAGADDNGTMTVNGVGSTLTLDPGSALIVASTGTGRLEVQFGASVVGDGLFAATSPGSDGDIRLVNSGTTASFNNIYLGGSTALVGGNALLTLDPGSTLNLTGPSGLVKLWPEGFIDATGATINAPNHTFDVDGRISLNDGATIHAGSMLIAAGGSIIAHPFASGSATIDTDFVLASGAGLAVLNGDLAVGRATSPSGFIANLNAPITLITGTLTLLSLDAARVGSVTLAGGTLAAPGASGLRILDNGTIDGEGSITAPNTFFNSGGSVITATGAGITINGMLRNNSGTIDGTRYTFNGPDGGWTGAGQVDARVVFNADTSVNALANMVLGANFADGVTFNSGSELHADSRTVTLVDSSGIGLPSITDLNGGHIVCAQNLTVGFGRRLSGRGGSIDAPALSVSGHLSPGELIGFTRPETGTLTVNGNLLLASSSDTDIELSDLSSPLGFDRVVVNGTASLAGTLTVSYVDGFQPIAPFDQVLLQANTILGGYTTTSLPPNTRLRTTPTQIALVFCPADFNNSGALSVQDIFDFLAAYFSGNTAADFNHSGTISVQDIFDFLAAYFAGC